MNSRSESEAEYEGGDDSDLDEIDFKNYKGIYANDDPDKEKVDPKTGCHFEYFDLVKRLNKLKKLRKRLDAKLGLPTDSPEQPQVQIRDSSRKREALEQVKKSGIVNQTSVNILEQQK